MSSGTVTTAHTLLALTARTERSYLLGVPAILICRGLEHRLAGLGKQLELRRAELMSSI